jgi:hypothetical protein
MHVDEALVNNRTLALYLQREAGKKTHHLFWAIFMLKMTIYQDRLGTNIGKVEKWVAVSFLTGYTVGMFGKYLNNCPTAPPPVRKTPLFAIPFIYI